MSCQPVARAAEHRHPDVRSRIHESSWPSKLRTRIPVGATPTTLKMKDREGIGHYSQQRGSAKMGGEGRAPRLTAEAAPRRAAAGASSLKHLTTKAKATVVDTNGVRGDCRAAARGDRRPSRHMPEALLSLSCFVVLIIHGRLRN